MVIVLLVKNQCLFKVNLYKNLIVKEILLDRNVIIDNNISVKIDAKNLEELPGISFETNRKVSSTLNTPNSASTSSSNISSSLTRDNARINCKEKVCDSTKYSERQ
jgi:hypothetical protein